MTEPTPDILEEALATNDLSALPLEKPIVLAETDAYTVIGTKTPNGQTIEFRATEATEEES